MKEESKLLQLRFTKVDTGNGIWFDSNLVQINGTSGVHLELKGADRSNSVTILQSMTGENYVSIFQDYFGGLFDSIVPTPGIGQIIKFRVTRLPDYAVVLGDVIDAGDPGEEGDIKNAFAGKEGEYFRDKNSALLLGKNI